PRVATTSTAAAREVERRLVRVVEFEGTVGASAAADFDVTLDVDADVELGHRHPGNDDGDDLDGDLRTAGGRNGEQLVELAGRRDARLELLAHDHRTVGGDAARPHHERQARYVEQVDVGAEIGLDGEAESERALH